MPVTSTRRQPVQQQTQTQTQTQNDQLNKVRSSDKLLKKGSRGLDVAAAQKALKQAGVDVKVDGAFGPQTDRAVREFQQKKGLKVDGIIGKNTMAALDGRTTGETQQPQRRPADGRTQQGARERARANDQQGRQRVNGADNQTQSTQQGDFKALNQADPRWGNQKLGNSRSNTLRRAGCMLAAFGMAAQAPALGGKTKGKGLDQLNKDVRSKGGFSGAALVTGTAARAMGMNLKSRSNVRSGAAAAETIRKNLDAGKPVVAGVDYKAGSRGSSRGTGVDHWITITGRDKSNPNKFHALDPAGGKKITLTLGADGVLRGGPKNYKVRELIQFNKR